MLCSSHMMMQDTLQISVHLKCRPYIFQALSAHRSIITWQIQGRTPIWIGEDMKTTLDQIISRHPGSGLPHNLSIKAESYMLGKKMAVAVDSQFFATLPSMEEVDMSE